MHNLPVSGMININTLVRVALLSILRLLPAVHNLIFFFNSSGVGLSGSEHIDLTTFKQYKEMMKIALRLSGFANKLKDSDKLLPCPLGTYVNFSVNDAVDFSKDVECSECPAGRVLLLIVNCNFLTEEELSVGVLYVFVRFR